MRASQEYSEMEAWANTSRLTLEPPRLRRRKPVVGGLIVRAIVLVIAIVVAAKYGLPYLRSWL